MTTETFTLDPEQVLSLAFSSMASGMASAFASIGVPKDVAQGTAAHYIGVAANDPAIRESLLDNVRRSLAGESVTPTWLRAAQ